MEAQGSKLKMAKCLAMLEAKKASHAALILKLLASMLWTSCFFKAAEAAYLCAVDKLPLQAVFLQALLLLLDKLTG